MRRRTRSVRTAARTPRIPGAGWSSTRSSPPTTSSWRSTTTRSTARRTAPVSSPITPRTSSRSIDASKGYDDWGFEPVPRVRDVARRRLDAGWRHHLRGQEHPGTTTLRSDRRAYAEALCELFDSTEFPLERLVVICFWAPTLDAIKQRNDKIALGYLSVPSSRAGWASRRAAERGSLPEQRLPRERTRHWTPDLTAEHVQALSRRRDPGSRLDDRTNRTSIERVVG